MVTCLTTDIVTYCLSLVVVVKCLIVHAWTGLEVASCAAKCIGAEVAALYSYWSRRLKCWKYVQACLVVLVCFLFLLMWWLLLPPLQQLPMVLTVPMVTATTIAAAADGADSTNGYSCHHYNSCRWCWQYQWLLLPPLPQLPMVLTVPLVTATTITTAADGADSTSVVVDWCFTQSIIIAFLIQVQMGHSNYIH